MRNIWLIFLLVMTIINCNGSRNESTDSAGETGDSSSAYLERMNNYIQDDLGITDSTKRNRNRRRFQDQEDAQDLEPDTEAICADFFADILTVDEYWSKRAFIQKWVNPHGTWSNVKLDSRSLPEMNDFLSGKVIADRKEYLETTEMQMFWVAQFQELLFLESSQIYTYSPRGAESNLDLWKIYVDVRIEYEYRDAHFDRFIQDVNGTLVFRNINSEGWKLTSFTPKEILDFDKLERSDE